MCMLVGVFVLLRLANAIDACTLDLANSLRNMEDISDFSTIQFSLARCVCASLPPPLFKSPSPVLRQAELQTNYTD